MSDEEMKEETTEPTEREMVERIYEMDMAKGHPDSPTVYAELEDDKDHRLQVTIDYLEGTLTAHPPRAQPHIKRCIRSLREVVKK